MKTQIVRKIFTYNDKSILNNRAVKFLNYVLLGFSMILLDVLIRESNVWYKELYSPFIFGALVFFVSIPTVTSLKLSSVDFFEWDYTERKKKERVTIFLMFITSVFSFLFILSIVLIVGNPLVYIRGKFNLFLTVCNFLIPTLFLLNLIKSYELHNFLFKENLTIAYKIQKKPEHWIEHCREIKREDEYMELLENRHRGI